ncbi:MAG: CRISPR-associated protein Csx11 [Anaerolineae bacterium]
MSYDLKVLVDHRNELLLAEVAAWLHDMGKCADEHVINQATDRPSGYEYQYKTAHSSLIASAPALNLLGESIPFQSLVEQARPRIVGDSSQPWLLRALGRCHAAAHIEKEEADRTGKQPAADTRMSTAYGFELPPLSGLTTKLQGLPYANLTNRTIFRTAVQQVFSNALGETRRPENEIALWDWSSLVAALYKAALAGALLGHQPQPTDLRWRLLSIRVDEVAFLDHITRFPDLLARQRLLEHGFERIRILLEETCPLGTEVYRDESSSLYVVPNVPNLCNMTDGSGTTLEELVRSEFVQGAVAGDPRFALSGEIVPDMAFDSQAWWGQRPDRRQPPSLDEVPPIGRILQQAVFTHADVQTVTAWWTGVARDICPVCGLRPQAPPTTKAGRRNVCEVCEGRRDDRAKAWVSNLHTTIWTDEVADDNGRLALVVGRYNLDRWLDGTLVQTLLVTDPVGGSATPKNPSFARLRRVWETTRAFWQETSIRLQDVALVGEGEPRLAIQPQDADSLDLGPFHTYELVVADVRISVVWDAPNRRFITCDNLAYLASPEQLGNPVVEMVRAGRAFPLEEPTGYGAANRRLGQVTIATVNYLHETYAPAIPILAEPRTFMALVPANKALAVVEAVKEKYEQEMGKVRNRLPLTVGVVYGDRRTPLAAMLDAGRRMLRRPARAEQAEVTDVAPQNLLADGWPTAMDVKLRLGEWEIPVSVPTVMGDGTTPDVWYPYWQVAGKPTDRTRWFVGPDGEYWAHVTDLRKGDRVGFAPSTFDFEYLDTSARRFEVAYESDGQRRSGVRRQRPYLLEEVEHIEEVWCQISRLSTSQIRLVEGLVEAKRRDWAEPSGILNVSAAFSQFVGDVLREVDIHSPELERAAITGMLADALEIHLTIHKEKPQQEDV